MEYRNSNNKFLKTLEEDLEELEKSPNIIISADKSRNHYSLNKESYDKILRNEITKEYKKSTMEEVKSADYVAAEIARKLKLDNRMLKHSTTGAYVTVKDHKDNFYAKMPCRLINTAKADIQKASKVILQNANKENRIQSMAKHA